ncbi:3-oxoacyl-[acyl-carrier-protein] synthase, KASIII [Olavius algarvensis spirochete endosymbiont]|uniref:beta-ketoacyl-ACP synthase III n=1 Tax=Olavius algarvensis spirochete endosymbiont TaxID=260710 RepID=UPI00052D2B20|nr:beta-ketoacyl-ACP synthase III [Olavius algarvensis spirochete endosymbiont]KGM38444.1 3-oxoacyl-ACP synthase [Alkalispirochaeta odontotermitis]CAD7836871.1 MAG: 3-oxoacyl-[acyl-carrier-protein] synthase, KASIII (EC 2.3.1.180) [Olavius algarvensis spirochete endosymbiont]VDA99400.1 3-oxoacyl-[acyl-carrier-protein] synthase, KASIII [Olavius algarvensis spirochete endosymbiont]
MTAGIVSVGSYIPPRRVGNDELSRNLDTSDEWIRSHTGISNRHIASDEETCSYMAIQAARMAMENANVSEKELDFIIVATITPDYRDFPATANLVQYELGAGNICSFDIKAACTGFIYGLVLGRSLILSGTVTTGLVIGAEKLSAIIDWEDRSTAVLFGDGAGAAILRSGERDENIVDSIMRTDGSGADALYMPTGGTSTPFKLGETTESELYLNMDGQRVYNFAVKVNVEVVRDLMLRNSLTSADIDYIVPHQANYRIIHAASKRANIPLEKYYLNIDEYANTSSASIPIALAEMNSKGILKKGMKIITVGFGSGLTYGGNYIVW